jgi:hypothetical protein
MQPMPPISAHAAQTSPYQPMPPTPPIPAHATNPSPCHQYQPMPPMPPPCLMPYQILAAQVESSCAVNMISLSSSTAGRRNIFANSRTKGAPVTVFGSMVTTCICVGICGGGGGLLRAEDALTLEVGKCGKRLHAVSDVLLAGKFSISHSNYSY